MYFLAYLFQFFNFILVAVLASTVVFAANTNSDSGTQTKRQVELELEEIENATSYEVELTSKSSRKTQTFKMKTPIWKASIRPGEFSLRLRSYDQRGVGGPWSDPVPFVVKLPGATLQSPIAGIEIKTNEKKTYDTELKWLDVPGTKKYRVEVTPEGETSPIVDTFSENNGKIALPVARRYTWQVIPISKSGEAGEPSQKPGSFTLIGKTLDTPNLEKPEDIWVQTIKWEKPEYAENLPYILQRKDPDGSWKKLEEKEKYTDSEIPLDIQYPGGRYRFSVKAESTLRETSKVATIEFDVYKGDRSPAAVENAKLRYSLEKPTPWYFVASYLITQINYFGENPNAGPGSTVRYDALGGTGRLGLGYISPKTDRGYLGLIDLSGFTVASQNVTYASVESHYIWRYTWGRNMLRPSAGLFYKELIEAQDSFFSQSQYKMQKISYIGPHAGFDFWRPFTSKLGFQINARTYYSAIGMSSPNGRDQSPEVSFQLGLMGSYKLKPNIIGFMGWAHRVDRASYESTPGDGSTGFAPAGSKQVIQIDGDFFNLILEWGF